MRRVVLAEADVDDAGTVVYGVADARGNILVVLVAIGTGADYHQAGHVGGNTVEAAVLPGITGNDTGHERAVLTALDCQRRVAVEAVVGIVHVVAHQQALVLVVLNAVNILLHLGQTGQRQRVKVILRPVGYLVVAQVVVDIGLLAHANIEVVLLLVGGGIATGRVLVFRIQALELAVLLGAGTGHVELSVGGAEKVPAVYVVGIAVLVVVATVGALAGVRPQGSLEADDSRIDTRIDDAYHHRS